jgi:hypothetical protein
MSFVNVAIPHSRGGYEPKNKARGGSMYARDSFKL